MVWRGFIRDSVVFMANDSNQDERDIPWGILISLVVMCLVLVIALPIMGVMYMDMNNATAMAMAEARKMRELRAKILLDIRGE